MSKVNLEVNAAQSYGKYFPGVFINRIYIEKERNESGFQLYTGHTNVVCYLTINFTKNDFESNPAEYINYILGDLRLYCFLSANQNINEALYNSKLNLRTAFRHYYDVWGTRISQSSAVDMLMSTMTISQLIGTPEDPSSYGSYIVETGTFDKNGNEIIDVELIYYICPLLTPFDNFHYVKFNKVCISFKVVIYHFCYTT